MLRRPLVHLPLRAPRRTLREARLVVLALLILPVQRPVLPAPLTVLRTLFLLLPRMLKIAVLVLCAVLSSAHLSTVNIILRNIPGDTINVNIMIRFIN